MKYTVQSGKYVLKNFLYIFPFAVVPALFFCFSTDEGALVAVLESFFDGTLARWSFSALFRAISVFNFASWKAVAFGLIGLVAIVVCVALMMALMEKHMRIGKRTFNGIFSKLNDNLLSTSGYALLLLGIYELWSLLTAALLFFVSRIAVPFVAYAFVVIVFLAMHVVLLYAINVIYLWLPCMQITGFKATEALYYSNQLTAPVKWKIVCGQLLLLLFAEACICACVVLTPNPVWFTVLTTFLYAVLIMVYCVRMQIAYFDLDGLDRADLFRYNGR